MNTRRYPRTMQEAFGPYADDQLQPMPERSFESKAREFVQVYRAYRKAHPRRYALRVAYEIAFLGIPF
jgi:hypothetical protein